MVYDCWWTRVFELKWLFFLDLSIVDRRLHDDLRKIYLHLKAPRFDLHRHSTVEVMRHRNAQRTSYLTPTSEPTPGLAGDRHHSETLPTCPYRHDPTDTPGFTASWLFKSGFTGSRLPTRQGSRLPGCSNQGSRVHGFRHARVHGFLVSGLKSSSRGGTGGSRSAATHAPSP
jgi:hypothetical protein